jgi:hypothetical protein
LRAAIYNGPRAIVFDALLAQPLPHIPEWKLMARRPAAIHFDGLAGAAAAATEQ